MKEWADRGTLIPKTDASREKLAAVTALIAPLLTSIEQAYEIARAIAEFAEQAIRDDREQRA